MPKLIIKKIIKFLSQKLLTKYAKCLIAISREFMNAILYKTGVLKYIKTISKKT